MEGLLSPELSLARTCAGIRLDFGGVRLSTRSIRPAKRLQPDAAGTTSVGMAVSEDGKTCVANYLPGGNVMGHFKDNVLRPKAGRKDRRPKRRKSALSPNWGDPVVEKEKLKKKEKKKKVWWSPRTHVVVCFFSSARAGWVGGWVLGRGGRTLLRRFRAWFPPKSSIFFMLVERQPEAPASVFRGPPRPPPKKNTDKSTNQYVGFPFWLPFKNNGTREQGALQSKTLHLRPGRSGAGAQGSAQGGAQGCAGAGAGGGAGVGRRGIEFGSVSTAESDGVRGGPGRL